MKKITAFTSVLLATTVLLTSCGVGGNKTNDSRTDDEEELEDIEKEETEKTTVSETDSVELPILDSDGNHVVFGHYEQDGTLNNGTEPIEWDVISEKDGKVLLISSYVLDSQPYNIERENVTWETCSLRKWLNNEFYNSAFAGAEQEIILTASLINAGNTYYGTQGGNDTRDKIFCLSADELSEYYANAGVYNGDGIYAQCSYSPSYIIQPTQYAIDQGLWHTVIEDDRYHRNSIFYGYYTDDMLGIDGSYWWLRTPGSTNENACFVQFDGSAGMGSEFNVDAGNVGVRPAMWINADAIKTEDKPAPEPTSSTEVTYSNEGIKVFDSPASTTVNYDGKDYEFHIPMVTIDGVNTDDANSEIEKEISQYISSKELASRYAYFISDKIVTIIVYNEYVWFDDDWITTVFNIEIATGDLVKDGEVVAIYGISDEEFFSEVEDLYREYNDTFTDYTYINNLDDYLDENYDRISYKYIDPFIGPNGHLCFSGDVFYVGGGGGAPYLFDLTDRTWKFFYLN